MKHLAEFYYRLHSSYDDYDSCSARARPKSAFCRGCHQVTRDWYPRHVEVALPTVRRALRIQTSPQRVTVLHSDLWQAIEGNCTGAVIGPVTMRAGDLDRFTLSFVTVVCPDDHLVHVRSRDPVVCRMCDECGRQLYVASDEARHLVGTQLLHAHKVLLDHLNYVLVTETLLHTLPLDLFPDLVLERLPVVDRPLDGFRLAGDPDQ